jgi:O-antigen ligase
LVQVLVCLLRLPIAKPWKHALACVCLLGGLVGFAVKFSAYFARGAPSAEARRQYWRAAVTVARLRPLAGTGPGTFAANYRLLKPPEAEMALLTHNDYLQQACDSGLPGAAIYTLFVVASLTHLWRKHRDDAPRFAVWLGLLGWSMQGLTEFGLYIPALSWTAFLWFGWLTAQTGRAGSINGHRQTPLVAYRPVPG